MHSKAFHRILGVIVLFAIVLLILPFWDGDDELSINERVIHPPTFPDQPIHESAQTVSTNSSASSVMPLSKTKVTQKAVSSVDSLFSKTNLEHVFAEELGEMKSVKTEAKQNKLNAVKPHLVKEEKSSKIEVLKTKTKSLSSSPTQVQAMLWSIQIEGFENKTSALIFVNQLRRQGQRAYLQTLAYAGVVRLQVWIGPINNYRQAETLTKRVQNGNHLKFYIMRHDAWRS